MPELNNAERIIEAAQILRSLPEAERSEFYDSTIAPQIEELARTIENRDDQHLLRSWLEIQSSLLNFVVEGIVEVTDALRKKSPDKFQRAVKALPIEQRFRIRALLRELDGEETLNRAFIDRETIRHAEFRTHRPDIFGEPDRGANGGQPAPGILATFTGTSTFQSARGFPAIHGTLSLFTLDGTAIDQYAANTGGGALNFRTRYGPLPLGVFIVSNYRPNRSTTGMVFDGVGYSFDVDPTDGTSVFGRTLFRIHPDGGSEGTNGCIGIRENSDRLQRVEKQIVELIGAPGPLKMVVQY